ncbi:MAG: radical SAM protein [Bauldia sp.]
MIGHITLLRPRFGHGVSSDAMTPLVFAILKARTPRDIAVHMIDERVEPFVPVATDLVAMTVETFTAARAYEVAAYYRAKGVPVVMGGHHPSVVPDEALMHCDAVVIGDAEGVWERLLADAAASQLARLYEQRPEDRNIADISFDRSIFAGRRYVPVSLVQVGRGCRFACDFCSIHAFYGTRREQRPPEAVAAEIRDLPPRRLIFFVDDNLYWRRDRFVALLEAIKPLRRRWSCQISIDVARDEELLDLMAEAGCSLALIGFESLEAKNLKQMRKNWNGVAGTYDEVVARLHGRGIMIYGTFVFGYDHDCADSFGQAAEFADRENLAIANFNPLTPMPGTGLYNRLLASGELVRPQWWIDPQFRYGDPIFQPKGMTTAALRDGPMSARRSFYGWRSILRRIGKGLFVWKRPTDVALALVANVVSRREIFRKQAQSLRGGTPL